MIEMTFSGDIQDTPRQSRRRLLLVGHWQVDYYERALADGFEACGFEVLPFRDADFLDDSIACRIEKKLLLGLRVNRLNAALVSAAEAIRPDAVLFYHPLYIYPATVQRIRAGCNPVLLSYNNDNAYEDGHRFRLWRNYHGLIRRCDVNFFCRESDIRHAVAEGVPNPQLTRFWYIKGLHRPLLTVAPEFRNDVVFAGHYERDGRDAILEYLLDNGINLRIFGPAWELVGAKSKIREQKPYIVTGGDYVQALAGAKIALVFLSSRNKDSYTTRCFEIPACGTMMVAPRNDMLKAMFEEDREAVYYGSKEELVDKIRYYLTNQRERLRIAAAGYDRCMRDGHSNMDRARHMLQEVEEIITNRCHANLFTSDNACVC